VAGNDDFEIFEWRPGFVYLDCDVPIEFELILPQRAWRYRSEAVGGHDVATSGIQESFVIRHDRIYRLRLRFTETEWVEKLEPMLRTLWGQAQAFTVQLDMLNDATIHTVRLVSPWMTEGAEPEPHDYPGLLELELTLRSDDGSAFSFPFFPALDEATS